MSYGDPDPARETSGDEHHDDAEQSADPEQDAIEETEETGEINPSGLFPEGDQETETPV